MSTLPPGWETDLAVLQLTGSVIDDRGDHLVVSTPDNPDYHWGNVVFVTDEAAVNEADRWVETFQAAFPAATWVAIGLIRLPDDLEPWLAHGLDVELDEVLTTSTLPRQTPLPAGYTVRRLDGEDWTRYQDRAVADNDRTGAEDPQTFARFAAGQARARRALSERGDGAFFGAFAGETLVADLGIVRCGTTARYQSVSTDEAHRRRGLAAHLLGVAARWSAERGCDRWVIITESTNPAGRVYRSVGFEPDVGNAQAYRKPARPAVRVIRAADLLPADPTPGMTRSRAFEAGTLWAGRVETTPGAVSGWHHHDRNETSLYVVSGVLRLEFEGYDGYVDAQPGDFVHVPAFTVHRESNPTEQPSVAVIARAGGGVPTVNVDDPRRPSGSP